MANILTYHGRLVRDPELKKTQSGVSYLEITVAWSEKYKENETKCFLRCKAWRHTADFISNYFHKGQEIIIIGHMVTESWQDDAGQTQSRTICVIDKVKFCGSASGAGRNNTTDAGDINSFVEAGTSIEDEELPFS